MLRVGFAGFALLVSLLASSCGSTSPPHATSVSSTPAAEVSSTPAASGGITHSDPIRYEATYRVTASNGGFGVDRFLLYQPKPMSWDGQTKVHIQSVTPDPSHTATDTMGNGMYSWDLSGAPRSGESQPFVIRFQFTASETHTNLQPGDAEPYDRGSKLFKTYTASERYIESDDAQVEALAKRLGNGATDPLSLARDFYDYVIDNSTYVLTGTGLHGAKSLLRTGKGECGDYAALFVALSRAAGIPARPVVGYWAKSGVDQTHVWAEFFIQGQGWVPVDPTMGQRIPTQRDFYFGNMDNERVILNKGFNIELVPVAPDGFVAPFLQVPMWWFWGSGDTSAMSIERTSWDVTSRG